MVRLAVVDGPFIEAYLIANDFSTYSIKRALEFIQPVFDHVTERYLG
jgi:hypothetical protein